MRPYSSPADWQKPIQYEVRIFHFFFELPATNINSGHIGFAFEDEGNWKFLHMQLGGMSISGRFTESPERTGWIHPDIKSHDPVHIVAGLKSTYDRKDKNKIPYVPLLSEESILQEDGGIKFGGEGEGLTCSTFVVLFFTRFHLRIIHLKDWKEKADAEFHAYILSKLQGVIDTSTNDGQKRFAKKCLELVKKCPHAPRIKSQHVLAALQIGTYPVSFASADAGGALLMEKWRGHPKTI